MLQFLIDSIEFLVVVWYRTSYAVFSICSLINSSELFSIFVFQICRYTRSRFPTPRSWSRWHYRRRRRVHPSQVLPVGRLRSYTSGELAKSQLRFILTLHLFWFKSGMFYFPRLLWKSAEGGVMKLITVGLTDITAFMDKTTRQDGVELIAKYYNLR